MGDHTGRSRGDNIDPGLLGKYVPHTTPVMQPINTCKIPHQSFIKITCYKAQIKRSVISLTSPCPTAVRVGRDLFSNLNFSDAAELVQWSSLGTSECKAVAAAPVCSMRREAVRAALHTTQHQGTAD